MPTWPRSGATSTARCAPWCRCSITRCAALRASAKSYRTLSPLPLRDLPRLAAERARWPTGRPAASRALLQREQRADRDLVGVGATRVPEGHGSEVLEPECVATGPEPQQRVVVVTQLARERQPRVVDRILLRVRLVHPGVDPRAPVGIELVARLSPGAPSPHVP